MSSSTLFNNVAVPLQICCAWRRAVLDTRNALIILTMFAALPPGSCLMDVIYLRGPQEPNMVQVCLFRLVTRMPWHFYYAFGGGCTCRCRCRCNCYGVNLMICITASPMEMSGKRIQTPVGRTLQ